LLSSLGVPKVYLAGFDGFTTKGQSNYFTDKLVNTASDREVYEKNRAISKQIKKIKEAMEVVFLTPSAYDEK
jgi:glutaredoxin 2